MKRLLVLLISLVLTSCHNSTEPPIDENKGPLIPLAVGNYWVYQQYTLNNDGSILYAEKLLSGFKISDTLSVTLNGEKQITFQCSICDSSANWTSSEARLIYIGKDGIYYAGIADNDTLKLSFNDLMFKYPATKGEETLAHTFYVDIFGNFLNIPDSISNSYSCISMDSIFSTPIGNFSCIVYKLQLTLDNVFYLGDLYYFLKPGLGLVGTVFMAYSYYSNEHYYAIKNVLVDYKLN
jgi:hypothetical protein